MDASDMIDAVGDMEARSPQEIVRWGIETFGKRIALVTSLQRNSLAILDMAYQIAPHINVFTVDTGRLPEATLTFLDRIRDLFPRASWRILFPDRCEVEEMVGRKGPNLFYASVSNRLLCCRVRKVRPLTRALRDVDAWMTGLRRDEGPTRRDVKKVELDRERGGMVKLNPLADWSRDEVQHYLEVRGIPAHPLYEQGYTSIGCSPCSRPTDDRTGVRDGRWWWETDAPKECGINRTVSAGSPDRAVQEILDGCSD
ncbi:MAG: phosphoadenylyl-sulfate reductase [Rhodothermales bacterium]